jgi:predicted DNA-binding protein
MHGAASVSSFERMSSFWLVIAKTCCLSAIIHLPNLEHKPVPLRIDDETMERLDRLGEALTRRTAGVQVPRAGIIREVLDRGIQAMERELGLSRSKRRK